MSTNNSKSLARDKGGEAIQNSPPPALALARYTGENQTASSVISVSHDTTAIEIAAVGGTAAMRWIPITETAAVSPFASVITVTGATANYDHIIPSGTMRRFIIPQESAGLPQYSSMVGINRGAGLYQRVAIKSIGIASVLTSEY